jgi:hypothetical protein
LKEGELSKIRCEVLGAVVKQRNLAAVRKHCSPKKNYQSPFANRHSLSHQSPIASRYLPFTIRYSPFAIRCRFGSAEVSPSQFIPLPSHALRPVLFGAQFLRHQLRVKIRSMNGFDCVTDCGLKIRSMACF